MRTKMFHIISSSCLFILLSLQLHFVNGQDLTVTIPTGQISEGSSVDVTFALSETPVDSDFNVTIMDNTGEFDLSDTELTFPAGTTDLTQLISITLRNDDAVEEQVTLRDILSVTTEFNGQTSDILSMGLLLLSDDTTVLVAGFEEESYTFVEGDIGRVCVSINGTYEGSSSQAVTITYLIGTAVEEDDYDESDTSLEFDADTTDSNECFTVLIHDDGEFELKENFTIELSSSAPNFVDPARNVVTIFILDVNANCGPPPPAQENATVTLGGDYLTFPSGDTGETTVTNQGATASYACLDQELILTGESELVCELINDTIAEWSNVAPTCELPPTVAITTTPSPPEENSTTPPATMTPATMETSTTTTTNIISTTTEAASNTGRNIGIGVGVGVGGALLLLLLVLLIVFLIVRYKKRKTHSKYVLNYNTIYGSDQRPPKKDGSQPNEYSDMEFSNKKSSSTAATDAGGEDVPDAAAAEAEA